MEKRTGMEDLPEEIVYRILAQLNQNEGDRIHLKSISAVCKLFKSISNTFVRKLNISDAAAAAAASSSSSSYQRIVTLLQRFPSVKEIFLNFSTADKLDVALLAISDSSNSLLSLEKLRVCYPPYRKDFKAPQYERSFTSFKSLELTWSDYDEDDYYDYDGDSSAKRQTSSKVDHSVVNYYSREVIKFIHQFPHLTELDIARGCDFCRWNDYRVDKVTSVLPELRKINLSHNYDITDKTLAILSENCPNLESVNFEGLKLRAEALYAYFCCNRQLTSINMPDSKFPITRNFNCLGPVVNHLTHISLDGTNVNDETLAVLAECRPPLKSLIIPYCCRDYTMDGLSQLLLTCPDLISLDVQLPPPENCNKHDRKMSLILKGLPNLKHITVKSHIACPATLLSLVQNCPLLETIRLERFTCTLETQQTNALGRAIKNNCQVKINYSIHSVVIIPEADTWLLKEVESYCPKLKKQRKRNY